MNQPEKSPGMRVRMTEENLLTDALMIPPFDWGTIKGGRVLVLGIGGGCDIVSAYGLSTVIPRENGRKVFTGNTKGSRRFQTGLIQESEHIFMLPPEGTRIEAQETGWQFGTAKIDLSVPRGDDGITYLFRAPKKPEECRQLADEIRKMEVDFIVAVDTGGDVLKPAGEKPGRDQRMWRIIQESGIPSVLAVVAPGVDGETSYEEMRGLIEKRVAEGTCLGAVALDPLIPFFERLKGGYGKNRTPNLILRAWRGELPGPRSGWFTIPRHENPDIPKVWLKCALILTG